MIRFLLKGILRDKQRSLLPVVIVIIGVMLTVFMFCWLKGVLNDSVELNANFNAGHVKIMTASYAKNVDQTPNDLALIGVDTLMLKLNKEFPEMKWGQRIHFGGLMPRILRGKHAPRVRPWVLESICCQVTGLK